MQCDSLEIETKMILSWQYSYQFVYILKEFIWIFILQFVGLWKASNQFRSIIGIGLSKHTNVYQFVWPSI